MSWSGIKNKLFGWDYVLWKNTAETGIARVIVFKDGTIGYWRYRTLTNGKNVFDEINNPKEVHWLTCHPSKYFKEENANDNLPICNIKRKSHKKIGKCTKCKFNINDRCTVGTYYAEQGKSRFCIEGELWETTER